MKNVGQEVKIEEIKNRILDQTEALEKSLLSLEKADLILTHLFDTYEFYEKPNFLLNPMALASCMSKNKPKDKNEEILLSWLWDYQAIMTFMSIVNDYVCESKKIITAAL
jgi:hypothetical protein